MLRWNSTTSPQLETFGVWRRAGALGGYAQQDRAWDISNNLPCRSHGSVSIQRFGCVTPWATAAFDWGVSCTELTMPKSWVYAAVADMRPSLAALGNAPDVYERPGRLPVDADRPTYGDLVAMAAEYEHAMSMTIDAVMARLDA
ncbi:MAG TPA: hypothetical protein VE172_02495 [Stackebrandtia sp.]|jgi:hypothetical protein|uniref:hypothetical protein n=1 Tax=Stackebrandtia sp. TaxID=2023065 RepID=UPI002D6D1FB7|nr:hypothetical protein [Stackebrandtia sp.]HZE37657.1 hypothetical protein [Stackebrandtia sp.]